MGPVNHLPLRNRLFHVVAGVRREIAGAIPTAVPAFSRTTARRFGTVAPAAPPMPPQLHPVLGGRGQPGVFPDGLHTFDRCTHRKRQRPLGGRLLSTGASTRINNNGSPCWKCKSTVGPREYFCECGAVQLLDGRVDYFEMFDCPPSVFLGLKEVEKRFKNMQRAFHPVSAALSKALYLLLTKFVQVVNQ